MKIHFIGICGSGMSTLALMLAEKGHKVQGSDLHFYPPAGKELRDAGFELFEGFSADNLKGKIDLVVVGNVVSKSNPEYQAVLEQNISHLSMTHALDRFFMEGASVIAVTGTHGKTTTTAMVAYFLDVLKQDPGYFIGGKVTNFPQRGRAGKGHYFVVEGDEYDTACFEKSPKFLHMGARHIILTSIDFDHADIYASLEDIKSEFIKLLEQLPEDGIVLAHTDDPNVSDVLSRAKTRAKVASYGGQSSATYVFKRSGDQFVLFRQEKKVIEAKFNMIGEHNALNLTGALGLLDALGFDLHDLADHVGQFTGVKKRQEHLGVFHGADIFDDFAHHPKAISLTLAGFKAHHPNRRLVAVLEPRSNTMRRKLFQKDLTTALSKADVVYLTQVYTKSDGLAPEDRLDVDALSEDLKEMGVETHVVTSDDDLSKRLEDELVDKDVLVLMSNGDLPRVLTFADV